MSGIHEVGNTTEAMEDKSGFRASSTDMSKTKYSLDGVEDGAGVDDVYSRANAPRPGFTKSDQKDMYRMGKIQEFRVSCKKWRSAIAGAKLTTIPLAQLPSIVCSELCNRPDLCVGISLVGKYTRLDRWWARWTILELHLDIHRVWICCFVFG
jgi:hypothetical protein